MRDDDELGPSGVAAKELDEAADVRVVERGLDLVQEVERTRTREEERKQERDRPERLLAAGEQRQPRHAFAGRLQLDLDPGRRLLVLRALLVGQEQPTLAAREQRLRDLLEVGADRGEGLHEAAIDRLVQLIAQLRKLVQAALEILALRDQVGQILLFPRVLFRGQRIHPSELFATPAQALGP